MRRAETTPLTKSALAAGVKEAYLPLAICYAEGRGTYRDEIKARQYLVKALSNGIEGAEDAMKKYFGK